MKRLSEQTLYEILEIPQDASAPAIEAAVERARSLYGPGSLVTYTLMSPDEAALLGARIDEAKRVLLDPDARGRYDASLASADEVRAAVNGTNGVATPPFTTPIPVIPAVQLPPDAATTRPPDGPAALAREGGEGGGRGRGATRVGRPRACAGGGPRARPHPARPRGPGPRGGDARARRADACARRAVTRRRGPGPRGRGLDRRGAPPGP